MAYVINDPGFDFDNVPQRKTSQRLTAQSHPASQTKSNRQFHRQTVTSNKTSVTEENEKVRCAIHNSHHPTSDCNAFRSKSISEKKDILRKHGQCFKCCDGKHLSNNCHVYVKCDTCGSRNHCAAMHNNTNQPYRRMAGRDQAMTEHLRCIQILGRIPFHRLTLCAQKSVAISKASHVLKLC